MESPRGAGSQERSNSDLVIALGALFIIAIEILDGLTVWGDNHFNPITIVLALLVVFQSWRLYKSEPPEEEKSEFTGRWIFPE